MEIEQISIFVFAFLFLSVALYSKTVDHKWFPELALGFAFLSIIIAGVDPKTLKQFVWKQNNKGQEVSFSRHSPSRSEINKVLKIENSGKELRISNDPLVKDAQERIPESKSATDYLLLATNSWQNRQYEDGLKYAFWGLGLNPKDNRIKARLENRVGTLLSEIGAVPQAIKHFKKAMKIDGLFSWPHFNMGIIYKGKNQLEEAEKELRKAIEIDSKHADAHFNLANLLKDQNRLEEAESEYRLSIKLDSQPAAAYTNLGTLLAKQKKFTDAEEQFREAIKQDPKHASAYKNLGTILGLQKRYKEAKQYIEKGKSLELSEHDR